MAEAKKYSNRFQNVKPAQLYADRFETGSRQRINQREQRAVRTIFSGLPDCRSIVDVPSGAGRFAKTLASDGHEVFGIDVAFEILRHGQERTEASNVHFTLGEASRLPLRDNSVDCVFCNRLLHHIHSAQERAAFLKEFHRVSRRYVVVSFFDYHAFGKVRKFLKALKGRRPAYDLQPTFEQFTAEVLSAGFKVRGVQRIGAAWIAQKYFVLEKA